MITLTATDTLVISENRSLGIMKFGDDNLYPQNSNTLAQNSTSLRRCVNTYEKFIFGKGVTEDDNFWKRKVNPAGLRVDQFFRRIVKDYSVNMGFAVHIGYNLALEKVFVQQLPFENFRLPPPDDEGNVTQVWYYSDWSKSRIDKKDILKFSLYTTDKDVMMRQIELAGGFDKWNGHVMYYGQDGLPAYPYNSFHSGIEDAVTDIKLKKGRNANASTNFMASHMIQFPFMFADVSPYPADRVAGSTTNTFREETIETFKKFQGLENTGKLMVLENPSRDKDGKTIPFEISKLDIQDYDKLFELTQRSVEEKLRGIYNIPEILLNAVATGFSTEIMNDSYNYYNNITTDERLIMEETMRELFTGWDKEMNESGNYAIQKLTFTEIDTENDEALIVQIGIGGTQALKEIVVDPVLTPEQKVALIVTIFGLEEETARKIMQG